MSKSFFQNVACILFVLEPPSKADVPIQSSPWLKLVQNICHWPPLLSFIKDLPVIQVCSTPASLLSFKNHPREFRFITFWGTVCSSVVPGSLFHRIPQYGISSKKMTREYSLPRKNEVRARNAPIPCLITSEPHVKRVLKLGQELWPLGWAGRSELRG